MPETADRTESLFAAAVALSPEEREAYLEGLSRSKGLDANREWCENSRQEPPHISTTSGTISGIMPRLDIDTGEEEPSELKDLRKDCATYHDEHVLEVSVEILGRSVGGITYRH
jgi:hypothetical protein